MKRGRLVQLPVASALVLAVIGGSGCATTAVPGPAEFPVEKNAANFTARSLRDEGLHRFLAENLGHDVGETWDFEALSWTAFYFNPALALARAQWSTARAAENTAQQRPNPTLTLAPGYNTTREPGLSPWMPAIDFDVLLPTRRKGARSADIARFEADAARLAVIAAAWQVRSELRRALANRTIAARRAAVARAQVEEQRTLVRLLEQRYTAGAIPATDVSQARAALLRFETAAADAASQQLAARARVAAALGVPAAALEGATLPTAPGLSPLAPAALASARREALETRPDILAALAKYRAAHAALELEVAKQVPDFHLGPGYQWDQGANKWTLGVSFELPVFHRNEAPIAEALARRAEAAAQVNAIQAQVSAAIDAAVAEQQAAAEQLARARALRAEIEKQVSSVRQRLAAGAADQVEVQTAKLDLANVDAALADAENTAALAAGQLEDALQLPFPHLEALATAGRVPVTLSP